MSAHFFTSAVGIGSRSHDLVVDDFRILHHYMYYIFSVIQNYCLEIPFQWHWDNLIYALLIIEKSAKDLMRFYQLIFNCSGITWNKQ